jgi:hypothetical protein
MNAAHSLQMRRPMTLSEPRPKHGPFLFYQRLITWLSPRHAVASPWTSIFGSGHFEPTAGPE